MKLYKKIITLEPIDINELDNILIEIAKPIIERNRKNNWNDDNFDDILNAFEDEYILDISEYDSLYDKIRNLIKTI
jgi:hypothetical protein